MMPLIGTKLHVLNQIWRKKKSREDAQNLQQEEEVPEIVVPETQEICKNTQELQRKNRLYAANIWTCRVTGKSNLTFRDAVKCEVTSHRILRKNFPKFFERVILEMVHLNKLPIEALVHSCWLNLHEQFHVAEPVKLKVESVSSTPIHGIINEVDKSLVTQQQSPVEPTKGLQNTGDSNHNSVSPNSSDKENTSSKRHTPIKKKNYAYTVKVFSDIPIVVHDVPACSIDRINRAPVKEHIRMFIRAHAMRYGPNCSGPWIVDADMLRRYKIAPKCDGFEVDKMKVKQLSNEIEMEYFSRLTNTANRLYSPTNTPDGPSNTDERSETISTPIRPFKRTKHFSVLRENGNDKTKGEKSSSSVKQKTLVEDNLPSSTLKQKATVANCEETNKKKMKQVTLFQLNKNATAKHADPDSSSMVASSSTKQRKMSTSTSSTPALPRAAQYVLKLFTEKPNAPILAGKITTCARLFTDSELVRLPAELRDRISLRREALAQRKRLLSMSPQQRKTFLKEERKKQRAEDRSANRLIDDADLMRQLPADQNTSILPEPSPLTLPDDLPQDLFGRLLGVAEFFHSFQSLLLEDNAVTTSNVPGDGNDEGGDAQQTMVTAPTFPLSANESKVSCWGTTTGGSGTSRKIDSDEQVTTDEEAEEEAALADMYAAPPMASVRAMRRLGVHQLAMAMSATGSASSVGTYRSLARPLSLILRLLLRDEELNRKRELGIKLSKLPVTPYTAPELLRLVLLHELKTPVSGTSSRSNDHVSTTNDIKEENDCHANDTATVSDSILIDYLARADLHRLPVSIRILALETAVERLFDLDLIDDHILACQRRATEFYNRKNKILKDRNIRKKQQQQEKACDGDKKDSTNQGDTAEESGRNSLLNHSTPGASGTGDNAEETRKSLAAEDLASIVKRRRVLAAQAAVKREEKDHLERERRAAHTEEAARDRILATISRCYDVYQAEVRCALRCQPLGYDRYYRRIWYLRSAPDRLFVESNWASLDIDYSVSLTDRSKGGGIDSEAMDDETLLPLAAHRSTAPTYSRSSWLTSSWSSWAVYDDAHQLDELVNALFTKGIRESRLKQQLMRDGIVDAIKSRWKRKASQQQREGNNDTATGVSLGDGTSGNRLMEVSQRLSAHRMVDADTALVGVLLKHILDTEVRLRSGGLGGVPNFEEWQKHLAELQDSLGLPSSSPESKRPSAVDTSAKSTKCLISSEDKVAISMTILAKALVHVADHIMPRFLNVPDLTKSERNRRVQSQPTSNCDHAEPGQRVKKDEPMQTTVSETETDRDARDSDTDSDSSHPVAPGDIILKDPESHELRTTTWLSLWRSEVSIAKTLARLNLLHACLDNCVHWEKSVEDARCRICRRKSDDDNLLLCDGCNLAFHLYCLRPPLRRVPTGDWFCVSCRPASRELERRRREARLLRSERRRRQPAISDDDEDDVRQNSISDDCAGRIDDSSSDAEFTKRHRSIVGKSQLKRGDSKNHLNRSKSSGHSQSTHAPVKHDSVCLICSAVSSSDNELIVCGTCPNAFHLLCHNPPIHHVPRGGGWQCTACRGSTSCRKSSQLMTRTGRRISYLSSCDRNSLTPLRGTNGDDCDAQDEITHSTRRQGPSKSSRSQPQRRPLSSSASSSSGSEEDDADTRSRRVVKLPGSKRRRMTLSSSASEEETSSDHKENKHSSSQVVCSSILSLIMKHRGSWPFREPVDREEVPDYYDIVTDPIDLTMVQQWLSEGRYDDTSSASSLQKEAGGLRLFIRDLGQIFYNAELYNSADSDVWLAGGQLENYVRQQISLAKCGVSYSRPAIGSL